MTAPLSSLFAAGLFDSPWVIVVIVIVSAVANWLSKRREQKQTDRAREINAPPPPAGQPTSGFNLEETLRRLMGEELPSPPPVLAPPPLPRAVRSEPPPVTVWREEKPLQSARQAVPPMRLPPIMAVQSGARFTDTAASEQQARADRRFEQLNEQGRHPATVISHGLDSRSQTGKRTNSPWRNPRSARQAFVASLIFAPPKGLES